MDEYKPIEPLQPINIWRQLIQWGDDEWLNNHNKDKAIKLWNIAKKYESLQYKRIFGW